MTDSLEMKKFLNSIVAIFIFLGVSLLTVIFFISGETEGRFRSFVKFLNNNEAISTEIVSFKKGLFTSEAITRSKPKFIKTESAIQIKHTIWNGPLIFTGSEVKPDLPPTFRTPC